MECKNCKAALTLEDNFCNNCGGRVVNNHLTFGYLANEFSERFMDIDNNLLIRTFTHLFSKPESVINGYIGGQRKRYLNVV